MARRARPSPWLLVVIPALMLVAAGVSLALDRELGLHPLLEMRAEVARHRERVDALERERGELLLRIRGLRSDPLAVEAAAREHLGMVRPGEIVIHWQESESGRD